MFRSDYKKSFEDASRYQNTILEQLRLTSEHSIVFNMAENYFKVTGKSLYVPALQFFNDGIRGIALGDKQFIYIRQVEEVLVFYPEKTFRRVDDPNLWPNYSCQNPQLPKDVWFYILEYLTPIDWIRVARVNKQFYEWIIKRCDSAYFPLWRRFRSCFTQTFHSYMSSLNSYHILRYLYKVKQHKLIDANLDFILRWLFPFENLTVTKTKEPNHDPNIINVYTIHIGDHLCILKRIRANNRYDFSAKLFKERFSVCTLHVWQLVQSFVKMNPVLSFYRYKPSEYANLKLLNDLKK